MASSGQRDGRAHSADRAPSRRPEYLTRTRSGRKKRCETVRRRRATSERVRRCVFGAAHAQTSPGLGACAGITSRRVSAPARMRCCAPFEKIEVTTGQLTRFFSHQILTSSLEWGRSAPLVRQQRPRTSAAVDLECGRYGRSARVLPRASSSSALEPSSSRLPARSPHSAASST